MKRYLWLVIPFILCICACKDMSRRGPEFRIWNGPEPGTLDPHLTSSSSEQRICLALFEGLFTNHPETSEPVKGLVESWTANGDHTIYTFKLREARWSDGTRITADTVVASWLRVLEPQTAAPFSQLIARFIKGAKEYYTGRAAADSVSTRAVDAETLSVELTEPTPYFPAVLTHPTFFPVPDHAIKQHGRQWSDQENIVCSGPFAVEEIDAGGNLTCLPNPYYWDREAVKLGRITYIFGDDAGVGRLMFMNGETDWATDIKRGSVDSEEKDHHRSLLLGTCFFIFQSLKPPFDDLRVRTAFSLAIDRTGLLERIEGGVLTPATRIVPERIESDTPFESTAGDEEMARRLLADAGYPQGRGFPVIDILVNGEKRNMAITGILQKEWKQKLGILSTVYVRDHRGYLAALRSGSFEIVQLDWRGSFNDPVALLELFEAGSRLNQSWYENPLFDNSMRLSEALPVGEERLKVLTEAEAILIDQDMAAIPLYHHVSQHLIDTGKWGGWFANIMDRHHPEFIYRRDER